MSTWIRSANNRCTFVLNKYYNYSPKKCNQALTDDEELSLETNRYWIAIDDTILTKSVIKNQTQELFKSFSTVVNITQFAIGVKIRKGNKKK